jgi:hypothetical protein
VKPVCRQGSKATALPFHHSIIPSFHHSTIPPFHHSIIPSFHHSTIPPFHHSTIPPFHPALSTNAKFEISNPKFK